MFVLAHSHAPRPTQKPSARSVTRSHDHKEHSPRSYRPRLTVGWGIGAMLVEIEEAAQARPSLGDDSKQRQREHQPGDAAVALVDDGVEHHGEGDDPAHDEESGQSHHRGADGAVEFTGSGQVAGQIELGNGLQGRNGDADQRRSGQQDAGVIGRSG